MVISLYLVFWLVSMVTPGARAADCTSEIVSSCIQPMSQYQMPATPTRQDMENMCRLTQTVLDCLKPCIGVGAVPEAQTYLDGMNQQIQQHCGQTSFCMMDLFQCANTLSALDSSNLPSSGSLTDAQCQELGQLIKCYNERVTPPCKAISNITMMADPFLELHYDCLQRKCPAVATCGQAMTNGLTADGVSGACGHFTTFVGCVSGATCNGQAVGRPDGGSAQDLTTVVQDACAVLNSESTALSTCSAFSNCLGGYLSTQANLRPDKLCQSVHELVKCGLDNVGSCSGVTNVTAFRGRALQFMIRAGMQGCGDPRIVAGDLATSCPSLKTCVDVATTAATGGSHTYNQACLASANFQTCAATAAGSCNLLPPDSEVQGRPKLANLGTPMKSFCDAMSGQPAETCAQMKACVGDSSKIEQVYSTPGEMLNTNNWCRVMMRSMECLDSYKEACGVTDQLQGQLDTARQQLVTQGGCEDEFSSSGAEMWGFSLLLMLLSLVPTFVL